MGIDLVSGMAGLCWCRQNYYSICRFSAKVGSTSTLPLLIPCKIGKPSIRNTMTTNLEEFEFRTKKDHRCPYGDIRKRIEYPVNFFSTLSSFRLAVHRRYSTPDSLCAPFAVCLWVLCGSNSRLTQTRNGLCFITGTIFQSYPWCR